MPHKVAFKQKLCYVSDGSQSYTCPVVFLLRCKSWVRSEVEDMGRRTSGSVVFSYFYCFYS